MPHVKSSRDVGRGNDNREWFGVFFLRISDIAFRIIRGVERFGVYPFVVNARLCVFEVESFRELARFHGFSLTRRILLCNHSSELGADNDHFMEFLRFCGVNVSKLETKPSNQEQGQNKNRCRLLEIIN